MSRSYRHTPIKKSGHDESNREFKVEAHQKFRRAVKKALNRVADDVDVYDPDLEYIPVTDAIFPDHMRDVSEIWCSKQEYKYKEFGDFWRNHMIDIAQDAVIRAHYTEKEAERDLKWVKKWFRRMFYK